MKKRAILFAVVLILASVASLEAQINTASLTGLVSDPSGAVVVDAKVTAKNKATNLEQTTSSDTAGYYVFPTLAGGAYQVTVEMQGFKKAVADDVVLVVGQKGRLDFALQLGAVAESVTVEAAAPLLTTQEASTGGVVDNRKVLNLPLSQRNWDDLLGMVPGVQGDRYTEESGSTANGRTGGFDVHGVRSLQNNFILDGADNNSISENVQELTTQVARPSVDSIQEFKVTTSDYSAEAGRSPGGSISVTTKSGTNSFHGTAYEFLRNREFDANNFFLNRAGRPKGANVQNQYGANIGGPIVKNRAFFFFNYEGTRIRKGTTRLANVPMPNERIGDFSAAAAAANRTTYATISDLVGDCRAKAPAAFNANGSFVNNRIPAACFDPLAAKVLGLLPPPNVVPGSGALNANNFIRVPGVIDDTDSYTTREDWQITSKNNLFFRYTNSDRFRFVPGVFGGIIDGTGSSAFGRLSMAGQSAVLGLNTVLSARIVNEFRLGWGRNNSSGVQDPFGQNTLADFGIKGVADSPVYSGGITGMIIDSRGGVPRVGDGSGLDRVGSPDFLPKFQRTNQWQWTDTVSLSHGRHQFKGGADLRAPLRNIFLDVPGLRGTWTFDGGRTGIGLADFLLGYPSNAQLTNLAIVDARLWMMSYFFQDDFKVTPKLTVNLGLRYDYSTWPYEGRNRMTNLNEATSQMFTPANSKFGRSLVKSDKNNWSPRLGVAYQVTPKTVLRVGYGRFYQLFERAGSEDQMFLDLPWVVNNNVTASSPDPRVNPNTLTANNMRVNTGFNLSLDPNTILNDTSKLIGVRLRAVSVDSVAPSIDKWSLGLQRMLPGDVVLSLDYVGTKGTHLSTLRNLNQQSFNSDGTGTGVLPYPNLGPIEFRENNGNSMYHGLDLALEKRYSHGLAFGVAYTYSKSIDESMEHLFNGGTGSFTQNAHNMLRERRGRSDFDIRNRFVVGYNYDLPFGRGRAYLTQGIGSYVLGGWRISGVATLRSGRPVTIRASANDNLIGNRGGGLLVNALADCLRSASLDPGDRDVDRWFDTTAFALPRTSGGQPRLGSCGRNTLDAPGQINFDFALGRQFPYFGEQRNLEFRWEMFNMFNHSQFGLPDRNRSSSTFGRISNLSGDPRVMQFALKFYF